MIDSVKIKHVDQSLASKGARTLDVKVSSSKSFETPTRPISATELTAKSFLGYRGELQAPISALPVNLNSGDRYQKFLKNNGMVNETRRKLQSMSDSTYMCPSFPILQLPPLNPKDMVPFKIAFDMQCSVEDMDYTCIPTIKSKEKEFEQVVVEWCESAETNNKGAVPQIRMDEDLEIFSKKLNVLCNLSEAGLIQIINVVYANPNKNPLQFVELWRRREDLNVIVNCSEVPRKGNELHNKGVKEDEEAYLIQHGVDSITRRKWAVSPKQAFLRNIIPPPQSLTDVDGYDMAVHSASVRLENNLWMSTNHPLVCTCSVCKGNAREEIVQKFAYKDNGEIERSGLRYFSVLHDHQSDQSELKSMRKFIKSSEMNEYEKQLEQKRKEIFMSV